MSQHGDVKTTEKSTDKKEIAHEEEEREKMLNAENTRQDTPETQENAEEQRPRKKIPIGGIKMPGFCRTKSKEPCKDDESKPTESVNLEIPKKSTDSQPPTSEKPTTPAKEAKDAKDAKDVKEGKEKEGRRGILDAIRLPLVSVFPRKKNNEGCDAERGSTGVAGLASVETLDEGVAVGEKTATSNDDGMETVRLDKDGTEPAAPSPKQHVILAFLSMARRNLFVTVGTLLILLLMIIILGIACAGPRYEPTALLRDSRFISAVTSCGPVEGVLEDGAYAFRGIPYAIPPVDTRRWLPAENLERIENCWTGTYAAHNASEKCWQYDASGRADGVEDCLYLDVFTPDVRYHSPLPVVVMIGAETLSGTSPGVMQASAKLARDRDIVFVRPNFRLGIFGFLAAEPLTRSTHPPTSGNYGLSDVVAALNWVKLNIEHFGGNKSSVTLWGHRAGGTLVTTLVGSPRTKGLFARAWVSSGSAIFPGKPLSEAEQVNDQFIKSVRCTDAACLRQKSAEELMNAVPTTWYLTDTKLPEPRETTMERRHEWLVLDNVILREHVGQAWAGTTLPVSLVMGTTAQAGTPAQFLAPNATLNASEAEKMVRESLLGTMGLADEALRRYNPTLEGIATMISDIRVVCPLLTVALQQSTIPFYVVTQPRGVAGLADVDSDAAAILGTYAARTSEEKRHVTAMQQFFNHYVWHGEVAQATSNLKSSKTFVVGQDVLPVQSYQNCDFWISKDIVPRYARAD
ncbi:neurotactin [Neodiprion pinetum]|uniref:neurotactin n=1 Tax=Neodiprion pinetum TaxID=441929 RepID=UPI001EDE62FE|nr:neurotactin [Neodiprion pinetum]